MKTLNANAIINEVSNIHGGSMTRIGYKSEKAVKACFKQQGISVYKISETTVRIGVNYENIKSVKEATLNGTRGTAKHHSGTWVIKNRILQNDKSGLLYVSVATLPKSKAKVMYMVQDKTGSHIVSQGVAEQYLIESAKHQDGASKPVKYTIKVSNIYRIGKIGTSVFQK